MKKLFALVLAVAMVLSLASVAMAANTDLSKNNKATLLNGDKEFNVGAFQLTLRKGKNNFVNVEGDNVPYGKTVYIPLIDADGNKVTQSDAVSGLKVTAKWDQNGKYVKSTEIVKKDDYYHIAIVTQGSETKEKDVEGTLTLTGKAYSTPTDASKDQKKVKAEKAEIDVTLTMGFDKATDLEADDTGKIFNFEDLDEQDEETEITFTEDDDVTFTVDTTHQGEIVIAMDTDEIEAVEDAYPSANLDFFNFNGATFRKTGTLLLPGEEGQFVYEYKDGALQAVNAKWDSYEEAFVLKTKTLGQYVISDVELAVGAAVAPADAAAAPAAVAANPSTGAAL